MKPNPTYPRLYFRVWSATDDPLTNLDVSGITSAKYSRFVSGRWATAVAVGSLIDGDDGDAFLDGT
ncbi:hypothetical protein RMSM_00633, partial [Rhodopirellula maiorica SM1]